jgi:hypothetical protein
MAADDPLLRRVWPSVGRPYDMWLVLHGDLNRTARVRAVAQAISDAFERAFAGPVRAAWRHVKTV